MPNDLRARPPVFRKDQRCNPPVRFSVPPGKTQAWLSDRRGKVLAKAQLRPNVPLHPSGPPVPSTVLARELERVSWARAAPKAATFSKQMRTVPPPRPIVAPAPVGGGRGSVMYLRILVVVVGALVAVANLHSVRSLAQAASPGATVGQTFVTADEAVTALLNAVRGGKIDAVALVLGPGSERLLASGDAVADTGARQKFIAAYDEKHALAPTGAAHMTLFIGNDGWPFPIPLVQADGRWHFDAPEGAQELIDRRIGRDEIAAIRTSLAYVDAQKAFFAFTGKNGTAEYAQRLVSAASEHDGLYWPAAEGEVQSPLEPLVARALEDGYPGERIGGRPQPYWGYFFRILYGQGSASPEGAIQYISGDRMTEGFGLIAWPASYGASGIMTFIVNQDGIVFQKDLGSNTAERAARIKLFDPDLSWTRVDVVN